MYEEISLIKDGILYDTTDECIEQYRYANSLWILSVLSFTYILIIDRCINAPGHDRRKIDGINWFDRS